MKLNVKNEIKNVKLITKFYFKRIYDYYINSDLDFITRQNNEKIIFFLLTPSYGNIGDQAIELATDVFLEKHFSDYRIVKVHLESIYSKLKCILKVISPKDIVLVQGGGNFGDYYIEVELARRFIVRKIKRNKIFCMPSSIGYKSKLQLFLSKRIYGKNKNFNIVTRDIYSYNFSLKQFPFNRSILVPDIVLSIYPSFCNIRKDQISVCLRSDDEIYENVDRSKIIKCLYDMNFDEYVYIFDTLIARTVPDELKMFEFQSMLMNFYRSKLVITDRLHGLIFSYITNTPCIFYRSKDTKILGIYEWIKSSSYVKMIENFDQLSRSISCLLSMSIDLEPKNELSKHYLTLAELIKK